MDIISEYKAGRRDFAQATGILGGQHGLDNTENMGSQ